MRGVDGGCCGSSHLLTYFSVSKLELQYQHSDKKLYPHTFTVARTHSFTHINKHTDKHSEKLLLEVM